MKILFDLIATQPSGSGKRHGGGIYGEMVLRKLIEMGADIVAYYDSAKWLNPEIKKLIKDHNCYLEDINHNAIESIINKYRPDTFFSPLPEPSHNNINVSRKIGTLHGLRFLERPHDKLQRRFRNEPLKSIVVNYIEVIAPKYIFNKR